MNIHDVSGKMKIVTKCERVQPTVVGMDDKGEFIWEGREMPDWQKLVFPVRYIGDFVAHWLQARLKSAGFEPEPDQPSMDISPKRRRGLPRPQHPGD